MENLYSLSGNTKANLKRFQKRLKNQLYSEHSPEQNLNSILQSLQSMKESQKRRIREQSRKLQKKKGVKKAENDEKGSQKDKKKKSETSAQWIEKLDGFQHLNGCNININNNFINITTLQNKELKRNLQFYKELGKNCKINKLSKLLDPRVSPETRKKEAFLPSKMQKNINEEIKSKAEKSSIKRSSNSNKTKHILEKTEKKQKKTPFKGGNNLGKKLMSILKTSPENEKQVWFGNKGLKSSMQIETYNSHEKNLKSKKVKVVKTGENRKDKENSKKTKMKKVSKLTQKKSSIGNLKKSEGKERYKGGAKNEFNSLKKESRKLGGAAKKNFGTLDLRTYTNKENRRIPISCKNKHNGEQIFKKVNNKTLLDLFLQKKCDNIEDLLKQKMSKSRKEKIELMFKRESVKEATEIEGLAKLLEKPKPVLSHFHTSKEKSSIQETHESFLGLKPRTRMAKMVPNYINSIDNNINSIQNIHYRRKTDQLSYSRVAKNSNSPNGHKQFKIYSKHELKKIQLNTRLSKLGDLNNFSRKSKGVEKSKRQSNYSGIKRNTKASKRNRKSSQMKQSKQTENFQKILANKFENKERLRLRSITEIENYKQSRSIKHGKNNSSKNKNFNLMFKKKISLPDKQRKKETYRLFKSKWGINNNFEDSIKDSSNMRFDFRGVKSRILTEQPNKKRK